MLTRSAAEGTAAAAAAVVASAASVASEAARGLGEPPSRAKRCFVLHPLRRVRCTAWHSAQTVGQPHAPAGGSPNEVV